MALTRLQFVSLACVLLLALSFAGHAAAESSAPPTDTPPADATGPKASLTTAAVMGVVAAIVGCCFLMGIAIVVGCNKAAAKHAPPAGVPHHGAAPVVAHPTPIIQVPHPSPAAPRAVMVPPTPQSSGAYGYGMAPVVTLDSGALALGSQHGSYIAAPQSPTTWVSDPASPTPLIVKPEFHSSPIYTYGGQTAVPVVQFQ